VPAEPVPAGHRRPSGPERGAGAARAAGQDAINPGTRTRHEDWYRQAAATGIALNAARQGRLQEKRHAPATRMKDREADYLRFARDLRVPFTNYPDSAVMPMFAIRGGPAAGQGGALAA